MERYETNENLRSTLIGQSVSINGEVLSDAENQMLPEKLPGVVIAPLTKDQELALKKVRRKQKNKISAQESRRRKKEYIENLELRVGLLEEENDKLKRNLEIKDQTVRSLRFQLSKIKRPDQNNRVVHYQSKGIQTGICLKCYVQNQAGRDSERDDFKVQTEKNGRIIVHSDGRASVGHKSEYTDLRSIMYPRCNRYDTTDRSRGTPS